MQEQVYITAILRRGIQNFIIYIVSASTSITKTKIVNIWSRLAIWLIPVMSIFVWCISCKIQSINA